MKLSCGHVKNIFCGEKKNVSQDCDEICQFYMECGHKCLLKCHGENEKHNKKCLEICNKPKKNCSTKVNRVPWFKFFGIPSYDRFWILLHYMH